MAGERVADGGAVVGGGHDRVNAMDETHPFGRRGAPPKVGRQRGTGRGTLADIDAEAVSRTRKRTLGISLVTAGALAAAGVWFAESGERKCVDDPATPQVDESKIGPCATSSNTHRTSSGYHGTSLFRWVGGWGSSSSSSSYSSLRGSSDGGGGVHTGGGQSSVTRGGFGSFGSFHSSGGS